MAARTPDDESNDTSFKARVERNPAVVLIVTVGALATAVIAVFSLPGVFSDEPPDRRTSGPGLDVLPMQLGVLDGDAALEVTFVAGSGGEAIERLVVVEHFLKGSLSDTAVVPEGCGGRGSFVLTLADAALIGSDEGAASYRIEQRNESDFVSPIVGYHDSLLECADLIQLEVRPGIHIESGASQTLTIDFDRSLRFDTLHDFPFEGEPSSNAIDHEHALFASTNEYFVNYGVHIAGAAAHTGSGHCAAAALDLNADVPRPLDVGLRYEPHGTIQQWLCDMPERPPMLDSMPPDGQVSASS